MNAAPETLPTGTGPKQKRTLLMLIPFLVFAGLAVLFLAQLLSGRDASVVPSALIGSPAPQTDLPPLEGLNLPGLSSADFAGKVTLVNVWASWCAPCREEHPILIGLSQDTRFSIAGLNYKDKPENARRFLGELGNPYTVIGVDQTGRAAINWGVYGVPETYLVDGNGKIVMRIAGPITERELKTRLRPAMAELE